jgi:hypothetical protein
LTRHAPEKRMTTCMFAHAAADAACAAAVARVHS